MRALLWLLAVAAASLSAQAPTTALSVLPCDNKGADKLQMFRVASDQVVFVNCNVTSLTKFDTKATLKAGAVSSDGIVRLFNGSTWLRAEFPAGTLTGGKDYELVLAPDHQASVEKLTLQGSSLVRAPVPGDFESLSIPVSTKPTGTIKSTLVQEFGKEFDVWSNIAFKPFHPDDFQLGEEVVGKVNVYHRATMDCVGGRPGSPLTGTNPLETCAPENPSDYGRVRVALRDDHLYQAKATLTVSGLKDIFDQSPKVENDVTLGAVPKTKDDAMWYLKLDHQAGPGSSPGFAVEAKLAPTLGRPQLGGFFWQPALNMDIGSGSVTNVMVNDTIIPSLGLTRLYRFDQTGLEAVRFTPTFSFETNREFNKRNLVYNQDFQFFFSHLMASRLQNSWKKFKALPNSKDLKFRPDLADGGGGIQFYLGSETGHAVDAVTVKASKSTASVVVPTYSIARLKPTIAATAEYKRLTFTFNAVPRFLFAKEFTTRQSPDGKSISLVPLHGWRPYGEAGMTFGLDAAGHIALNTTYKLGSEPPTFLHANTVQSGLLLKY